MLRGSQVRCQWRSQVRCQWGSRHIVHSYKPFLTYESSSYSFKWVAATSDPVDISILIPPPSSEAIIPSVGDIQVNQDDPTSKILILRLIEGNSLYLSHAQILVRLYSSFCTKLHILCNLFRLTLLHSLDIYLHFTYTYLTWFCILTI